MVRFAESSDRQIELRAHLAIDALAPLTDLCAWGAFGNDLARIEIIPWLDGTFDVALDGELSIGCAAKVASRTRTRSSRQSAHALPEVALLDPRVGICHRAPLAVGTVVLPRSSGASVLVAALPLLSRVDSSKATLPDIETRREGEQVAGRYRLTSLHRLDDRSEVWRALDQSGQVITLEFLRDRDSAARERFVADARRMAAFQRPMVVRVAEIHDDEEATFIAFAEVGREPAAQVESGPVTQVHIEPKLEELAPTPLRPEPSTVRPQIEPSGFTLPEAKPMASAAPERPAIDEGDSPYEHGLAGLMTVLRARDLALFETSMLGEAAHELVAMGRAWLIEHRVQARMESVVAEARARVERADYSGVRSALGHAVDSARSVPSIQPHVGLPTMPRLRVPLPKIPRARDTGIAPAKPAAPKLSKPPRAPRFRVHVRWTRVLSRGLSLGLIAAAIVVTPREVAENAWSAIWPALDQGVRTASATIEEKVRAATTPTTTALRPATFELPPLTAYRAAFESQGAYPTASPGGTVEWVVALRNAGSVGWYRGIEGAQASLALADGTSVAVQSTSYVGPGQVGWFVVRFPAPSQPGRYTVSFLPRIDGRGPLPDLGIYAVVAVSGRP